MFSSHLDIHKPKSTPKLLGIGTSSRNLLSLPKDSAKKDIQQALKADP